MTIAGNKTYAHITTVGGAEFVSTDDGLFTVEGTEVITGAGGRRLNGLFKKIGKFNVKSLPADTKTIATGVTTQFASTVTTNPAPMFANGGQAFVPGPTTTTDKDTRVCQKSQCVKWVGGICQGTEMVDTPCP